MPVSESAPCSTKAEKFEHGNDQGPAGESVTKASGFFGGGAIILRHIPKDPKGIQRASMNFCQSSELPQCSLSVWFQLMFQYSELCDQECGSPRC